MTPEEILERLADRTLSDLVEWAEADTLVGNEAIKVVLESATIVVERIRPRAYRLLVLNMEGKPVVDEYISSSGPQFGRADALFEYAWRKVRHIDQTLKEVERFLGVPPESD